MIKKLIVLSLFLTVFGVHGARSQTPDLPGLQKIVTVNFNAAVLQTGEAQRDLSALQGKLAPRQTALKTLNDEIEILRKQLEAAGDTLSEGERMARTRQLETKQKQLQRDADDFKNESESESQETYQRVAQKVYAFLQNYAQQHGFSAVIERGSDANPIVWFAASNIDITADLIQAYDTQSGIHSDHPTGPKAARPVNPTPQNRPPRS